MENAEPPIRVAETVQDFFKRVSDPAEGIEEVPDTDSAESFEVTPFRQVVRRLYVWQL